MRRYVEPDADNTRWEGFEFRPGDIVVDAPSKSGTTWTQLLVGLLLFDGWNFPRALNRLSPWMEATLTPVEEIHARLAAQDHRRIIKSHTPLDGIPVRDEVRYVCVGRDPRDAAVSMVHHSRNIDRVRVSELTGIPMTDVQPPRSLQQHLDLFVDGERMPGWNVRFLGHHYGTFWERRNRPNVALFHFDDYLADLPRELCRLAEHLDIAISEARARELAELATMEAVRGRARDIVPEADRQIFLDPGRFLRNGVSGEGQRRMSASQQRRYDAQISRHVPPDLARWMHAG